MGKNKLQKVSSPKNNLPQVFPSKLEGMSRLWRDRGVLIGIFPKVFLVIILIAAFFVRTFRTDQLLRFYYDQGRDAIVVADMITNLKPVLVGPTTGLAGILRGPAFYYLLLPAYLISGNPVVAAIWLQIINLFGLFVFFLLANELFSVSRGKNPQVPPHKNNFPLVSSSKLEEVARSAGRVSRYLPGFLAVMLLGFSAHMVDLSRWLSNPSPILTTVPLMLYGLLRTLRGLSSQVWLPIVALMLGLNLQFEMASEIWFIPAVLILVAYSYFPAPAKGKAHEVGMGFQNFRPSLKTIFISISVFLLTLAPQIIFDLRHDGIMSKAVVANFTQQSTSSFGFDLKNITDRLNFYLETYGYIFSPNFKWGIYLLLALFAPLLAISHYRRRLALPLFFLVVPLFILAFYQGNSGNFYSYYLIGTFPIFLLLVSGLISFYLRSRNLAIFALLTISIFLFTNLPVLRNFLASGIDGPHSITIQNQLDNVDWIYQQADGQPFNVDIYVPPVIPYSYDYLFAWYGAKTYGYLPQVEPQTLEFTLYEIDPGGIRFPEWYSANTADHPVLIDKFSSGGVHSESRR
jgi:hypothetical protein